jgi:hypothetical protein
MWLSRLVRITVALATALYFVTAGRLLADSVKKFPDGYFRDRDNANKTLVVLVAGLAGEDSWKRFAELIDADGEMKPIDYLIYYSPTSLDIDQSVARLATILRDVTPRYTDRIYVGHSIGGMIIKRLLLKEADAPANNRMLPNLVVTYGTPLDTDKFNINLFKRLGARVFWMSVQPLQREVFNVERLKEINKAWRTAVANGPLSVTRFVSVFGVEDRVATIDEESPSERTVFIRGDHMGIVSPARANDCSFVIFKTVVKDHAATLDRIPCALGKQ